MTIVCLFVNKVKLKTIITKTVAQNIAKSTKCELKKVRKYVKILDVIINWRM